MQPPRKRDPRYPMLRNIFLANGFDIRRSMTWRYVGQYPQEDHAVLMLSLHKEAFYKFIDRTIPDYV